MEVNPPQKLYKVLSVEDFESSQGKDALKLTPMDDLFIHFSTEDQLARILAKFWSDVKEAMVLTIDSSQLPGKLVYEVNPGGSAKYYHLYNGSIPLKAILEAKKVVNFS